MRLGYGLRVKEVKGRMYVDAWRYEGNAGSRVQVFEYVGPLASPRTERRAQAILERYHRRAVGEMRRRSRHVRTRAARL